MYYGESSFWMTDPFYVHDEDAFYRWLDYWPEAEVMKNHEGQFQIIPSEAMVDMMYDGGMPYLDVPCYLRIPDEDGEWFLPEQAGGIPDENIFFDELSQYLADGEQCVFREIANDYSGLYGRAVVFVGGNGSFESRMDTVNLDDAFTLGSHLDGGRMLLGYAA